MLKLWVTGSCYIAAITTCHHFVCSRSIPKHNDMMCMQTQKREVQNKEEVQTKAHQNKRVTKKYINLYIIYKKNSEIYISGPHQQLIDSLIYEWSSISLILLRHEQWMNYLLLSCCFKQMLSNAANSSTTSTP